MGLYEEMRALDILLSDGEQSGRELRDKINEDVCSATKLRQQLTRCKLGWLLTMSLGGFYDMMTKLETAGVVEGWYHQRTFEGDPPGKTYKERWYRITEDGHGKYEEKKLKNLKPDYPIGWDGL